MRFPSPLRIPIFAFGFSLLAIGSYARAQEACNDKQLEESLKAAKNQNVLESCKFAANNGNEPLVDAIVVELVRGEKKTRRVKAPCCAAPRIEAQAKAIYQIEAKKAQCEEISRINKALDFCSTDQCFKNQLANLERARAMNAELERNAEESLGIGANCEAQLRKSEEVILDHERQLRAKFSSTPEAQHAQLRAQERLRNR